MLRAAGTRPLPTTSAPKRLVFSELARVGKALASPVRLELLDLLAQGRAASTSWRA